MLKLNLLHILVLVVWIVRELYQKFFRDIMNIKTIIYINLMQINLDYTIDTIDQSFLFQYKIFKFLINYFRYWLNKLGSI